MTKNTKRVHELEVGDIVNPPYDKSVLTIKSVRRLAENAYQIGYQGSNNLWSYGGYEEFTWKTHL